MRLNVTYSQYCCNRQAWIQQNVYLDRDKKLTVKGAQRVLRKMGYINAYVHSVEAIIYS